MARSISSLNDAVTLALENNYDIAIARINLDIADTDILRAKAGSSLRGVSTGIVANTLGGSSSTITGGGGPGGTTSAAGGGGAGACGLVLSTNGGGPQPELLDPHFTSTLQYESANTAQSTTFLTGTNTLAQNTATYNFNYSEGFVTGTSMTVGFDNSHVTTNSERTSVQPVAAVELPRAGYAAPAAGLLQVGERALHHPGEEQPPHHGLGVPAAADLHDRAGGEHLLGAGERVRGRAGQGRARCSSRRNWRATTASSCRSERWRRWMW